MEIQVLDGEIFILLQWCPIVLLYLWACHRWWHQLVFLGVHNSAGKHQLRAGSWPKRAHVRNAYLQIVGVGGWDWGRGREQQSGGFCCSEDGVHRIWTEALSVLQLHKGLGNAAKQRKQPSSGLLSAQPLLPLSPVQGPDDRTSFFQIATSQRQ